MIKIARPAIGIEPKHLDLVIGKISQKNIKSDEVIIWDKIN